ncbi:hypothetical protein B9T25_13740 [Acinetobacter sp. ANC 4470]|nr:hypothetical protein B9T25_13740 [Acinetobacter sp. ANC 4470]
MVCFLLLYRTFPSDVVILGQVSQQYGIPIWQPVVTFMANILLALVPLGCFLLLVHKTNVSKFYTITIPFIVWFISQFFLMIIVLIITFKMSKEPLYTGELQNIITNQLVNMHWFSNILISALIIMVCGYAFWRERKTKSF